MHTHTNSEHTFNFQVFIDDSRAGNIIEWTKRPVEYVSYYMNYCKVVH